MLVYELGERISSTIAHNVLPRYGKGQSIKHNTTHWEREKTHWERSCEGKHVERNHTARLVYGCATSLGCLRRRRRVGVWARRIWSFTFGSTQQSITHNQTTKRERGLADDDQFGKGGFCKPTSESISENVNKISLFSSEMRSPLGKFIHDSLRSLADGACDDLQRRRTVASTEVRVRTIKRWALFCLVPSTLDCDWWFWWCWKKK